MALPKVNRLFASNDASSGDFAVGPGIIEDKDVFSHAIAGNITADSNGNFVFIPNFAGKITNVVLALQGGADAVNPLTLAAVVKKGGTAVCSTNPAYDKAAGTGSKSTYAAGTGLTLAVLKTDGTEQFAAGDLITVDYDITRTASPGTELSQVAVFVYVTRFANQ